MALGTSTSHVMENCPGAGHGRVDHVECRRPQVLVSQLASQLLSKRIDPKDMSGHGRCPRPRSPIATLVHVTTSMENVQLEISGPG